MLTNLGLTPVKSYSVDEKFLCIVDKIKSNWPNFLYLDNEARLIKRRFEIYGGVRGTSINYDAQCLAFNKAFFLKNLYKNLVLIHQLISDEIIINPPIFDLGSGAGPSSIAYCYLFNFEFCNTILVDRSEKQLEIAKRIMEILDIKGVEYINCDIAKFTEKFFGTIFFSYWFCEQSPPTFLENSHMIKKIVEDSIILIDYPHNIIELENSLEGEFIFKKYFIEAIPSVSVQKYLGNKITVNACYYQPL